MKSLIFDSSTIITLAMNNLLWILEPLKKQFRGEFYISQSVKKEIIDTPLKSKKFKLEAMQVLSMIDNGILSIYDDSKYSNEVKELTKLANSLFKSKNNYIKILHEGEAGAVILAKNLKADALIVDERTTRVLLEDPKKLEKHLERKLHRDVILDTQNLKKFKELVKGIIALRSAELGVMAFEMGILDKYISKKRTTKKDLLDALLWAVKLRGCSISIEEINSILHFERL
ncbi:MAG: hypothetical protein ABIJ18_01780 [archaeon]